MRLFFFNKPRTDVCRRLCVLGRSPAPLCGPTPHFLRPQVNCERLPKAFPTPARSPRIDAAMSDLARFNAACDALRAKLQLMKDGGHIHHDGGPCSGGRPASGSARAAAGAGSQPRTAGRGGSGRPRTPSAVGLAALRIVLQHVCQADRAVLSARPDAPDRCFVVTCDASAGTKHLYAPALISKECAWRRLQDIAEETKAEMGDSFDEEERESIYHDDEERDILRLYDDKGGGYEFSLRGYELDGVLEDAETFLDLRSLASLRVVIGPDALCGKMFSVVVALRKVKMPRTLYAETPGDDWDDFEFEDLRVSKSVGALEDKFSTFRRFPADVLKLAATVTATWSMLPQPRPQRSSGDLAAYMARAINSANRIPCDTALRFMERRCTTYTHIANEHRWVRATVRPLPLVDQADSLAEWGKGVETLFEKVRRELDAATDSP